MRTRASPWCLLLAGACVPPAGGGRTSGSPPPASSASAASTAPDLETRNDVDSSTASPAASRTSSPSGQQASLTETKIEDAIARDLFSDPDYRQYVCGDPPSCDEPTFRGGLDIHRESLGERPPITGYFAAPKRYGENFYTGVFVVRAGQLLPVLTFFGSGITPSDRLPRRNGVKSLQATERVTGTERRDYVYEWNGSTFVEVKSATRK